MITIKLVTVIVGNIIKNKIRFRMDIKIEIFLLVKITEKKIYKVILVNNKRIEIKNIIMKNANIVAFIKIMIMIKVL